MVLFDVVISVCAMGSAVCTEVRIVKSGEHFPTPFQCAHYGQLEAEQFMRKYPRLRLAKYGCEQHKEKT